MRIVSELEGKGIGREHHREDRDSERAGKLVFHVFAALAEFERNLIRERTKAVLTAARGRAADRKSKLDARQIKEIKQLIDDPSIPPPRLQSDTRFPEQPFTKWRLAVRLPQAAIKRTQA